MYHHVFVPVPPTNAKLQLMYEKIMTAELRFPRHFLPETRSLLAGMLTRRVEDRLGYRGADEVRRQWLPASYLRLLPICCLLLSHMLLASFFLFFFLQIKSHPFFAGLDWGKCYQRRYRPEFVPPPNGLVPVAVAVPVTSSSVPPGGDGGNVDGAPPAVRIEQRVSGY